MNKSQIRKKIYKIRKQTSSKKFDLNLNYILSILKKERIRGKIIGGYYPYNYEINTLNLFKDLEKKNYRITLPKINGKSQMNFFHWSTKDPLQVNKFGIPEPISNVKKYPNILLVPLVAFDKDLNRIGYGGGFYDRYINKIKKRKKIISIGLAYSFQKVKRIRTNRYDMILDYVVTEKKSFK